MNFECGWTFLSCICAATKESLVKTEWNSLCASENNVRLSNFSISLCDGSDINEWVSFPSNWKFSHADSLIRSHCNAFSLSLSLFLLVWTHDNHTKQRRGNSKMLLRECRITLMMVGSTMGIRVFICEPPSVARQWEKSWENLWS